MKPKKVITVGVFDFFHIGHLNHLKCRQKRTHYLIVAVHADKLNIKGGRASSCKASKIDCVLFIAIDGLRK